MSTNSECLFYNVADGDHVKWYYLLEDYNAPKNAWDWREYAQAYGPFESEEAARDSLRRNHANPGGSTLLKQPVDLSKDEVLREATEKAISKCAGIFTLR